MFNPKQSAQTEKSGHFEEGASEDDRESWRGEKSSHNQSKILVEVRFQFLELFAVGECGVEVFLELVTLGFVLVEEESLEEEGAHDENFTQKSEKCHSYDSLINN